MNKVGGVLVTHGQVANELLSAAETVVGELDHIAAVSIGWHDDVELARAEIERAIQEVSQDNGVILMTDMFGGTPTNIAAMFIEEGKVELVTGVNLPMVIKLASQNREMTLSELAEAVEDQGKRSIYRTGALLETHKTNKDA